MYGNFVSLSLGFRYADVIIRFVDHQVTRCEKNHLGVIQITELDLNSKLDNGEKATEKC